MRRDNFKFFIGSKGQFYLIAAIIIIAGIIGFATIRNAVVDTSSTKVYDLGSEFGFESSKVVQHGVYNEYDQQQMDLLLQNFGAIYKSYIDKGENVATLSFIIGNKNDIILYTYTQVAGGSVSLDFGGQYSSLTIQNAQLTEKTLTPTADNKINVEINKITYTFDLKTGQNFYFIIDTGSGATSGGA